MRAHVPALAAARHNRAMTQREVGLILMRQLASGLAVPTIIFDDEGDTLFYNEAAEVLLGQRFDDVGELPLSGTARIFALRDDKGKPLSADQVPAAVAMRERRPVHRMVWVRGLDGTDRLVEVTAFPLLGGGGHLIGSVAMFWERRQ
jgi:PAS domain-containing protein